VFLPAMSLGMAVSAMTGQNLGAGKAERIKDIFRWGNILTSFMTIPVSLFVVVFPETILLAFGLGDDANVVYIGVTYLRIVGSCYIFFSIMGITNGVINGAGHTFITMVFTLLSLWLIRVPLAWLLSKTFLGVTGIWVGVSLSFFVTVIISLVYYYSGRWEKPVVGIKKWNSGTRSKPRISHGDERGGAPGP